MDQNLASKVDAFLASKARFECEPNIWRQWLKIAFHRLCQYDGFSVKRPLGNSGWCGDLHEALENHGITMSDVLDRLFEVVD